MGRHNNDILASLTILNFGFLRRSNSYIHVVVPGDRKDTQDPGSIKLAEGLQRFD